MKNLKKGLKKFTAFVMAVFMLFSVLPVSAASNTVTDWTWNLTANYGMLSGDGLGVNTTGWNGQYTTMSRYLPKSINATVGGVTDTTVNVENWTCISPADTTAFTHGGVYTFTANLVSPYTFEDGTNKVTLKAYAEGWMLNNSGTTAPPVNGWNEDHTVYTVTSQDNYPVYEYGNYSPTYTVYLADGNEVVMDTTDIHWDTHNAKWAEEIGELFYITGATATLTGRTDTVYANQGFMVTHAGDTTVYLNDYQLTSRAGTFIGDRMSLFSYSGEQTVTVVYSGTCRLPYITPNSSSEVKKLILKPADDSSVLYIEKIYRNGNANFSVEFDGGKVFVESGMSAGAITVKNGCVLHAELNVESGDNSAPTFQANTILIDGSTVTTSAEGITYNFNDTIMGSSDYYRMVEGSSITIQNGSKVTVDSSDAPVGTSYETYYAGIGNSETITITDSTVVVKQRDTESSTYSNDNLGTSASIGNVFKTLTIKNSNVTADAYFDPAIGMGGSMSMGSYSAAVVIEDSIINASSGYGAAIGIGYGNDTRAAVDVTIKGNSQVNARSVNGAGIGGASKSISGTDPDAVIINPSIPDAWEQVDGGSFGTYNLQRTVTPIADSDNTTGLFATGQTLTIESTESGTPQIFAESGVTAIACEAVTTDVTIVQNTTKTAASAATVIKLEDTELGTVREDFKSIAATMPTIEENAYLMTYGNHPLVNRNEAAGALYQAGPYAVTENTLNRFWTESQQELGGTVYVASSSSSSTVLTSATAGRTVYARVNKLLPASAAKTSPTPDKLTYQWYKDGVLLEGKTSASMYISEEGVYYCVVTGANYYYGSVTSNAVTIYKNTTTIPSAPQLNTADKNSITVKASEVQDPADTASYEYSIDGGATWQDALTFAGLEENTSYSIIRRVKDVGDGTAGPASAALVAKTTGDAPDAVAILDAIDYEKECFDVAKLPTGVVISRAKSTTASYQIDVALPGSLTSYIADYGKTEKTLYARYEAGDAWTSITIPSRPEAPVMYPEDILAGADSISITAIPGTAYNYAKTGQTPDTATAVICDDSGSVVFTNLLSNTGYTIHARTPASNENKHFHSAQTSINGKTLSTAVLETTIYIPAGTIEARTYDLTEVLGENTFVSVESDGTVISEVTTDGQKITLTAAENAEGTVILEGNLSDQSSIRVKVVISTEVVGENEDGTILWMWKQEDTDLSKVMTELLEMGDSLEVGTSRRLVPVYASGVNAGKRVPDNTAGTADILIPYWDETSREDRWILAYQQSEGVVEEMTSMLLEENGIRLNGAKSGIYGLYTVKSIYTDIAVEVALEGTYGTALVPEVSVMEEGYIPSDTAKWIYTYSTDGGENYYAEAPENVGSYYVKAVFIDAAQERRGEITSVFEIKPYALNVKEVTVKSRDYEAGNQKVEITGVIFENEILEKDAENVMVDLTELLGTISSPNAGTYTSVTLPELVLTGNTLGNYTLVQPQGEITTSVTINALETEILVDTLIYEKTFGDEAFSLSVSDTSEEAEVQYAVTEGNDVISVADGTVTILKAGKAEITLSLPASTNYLAAENQTITVNVAKSTYTVDAVNRSYLYLRENADTINLSALLPTDCGNVSYGVKVAGNIQYAEPVGVQEGILTYTVAAGAVGDEGTITVTLTTDNYEDVEITVNVKLHDQAPVFVKEGTEVTLENDTLTYGDALSTLSFNDAEFVDIDGNAVEGTLTWKEPQAVPGVQTVTATWLFTPNNVEYAVLEGIVSIIVNKATPEVTALPTVAERVYHPGAALTDDDLTGGTVSVEGTWSWKNADVIPTVENTGYEAVFTPNDTANYGTVTETIAVTVTKVIPYIQNAPGASAITYGEALDNAVLSNGVVQYSETDVTAIEGSFAWRDGTIKPVVADSEVTSYTVVFTPDDVVNYNTVETGITLVVNKAQNAPNMPEGIMSVPYEMAVAGDVTLPEGWIWQKPEAELEAGAVTEVTAEYHGEDKGNYENETIVISITRSPQPITPTPTPEETKAVTEIFTDVYEDWYTDYVQYVYDRNLMTGIEHTTKFEPLGYVTKAQVAQVLYNLEGKPEVEDRSVFNELNDVYEAEWYADAVAWAYSTGVITGDLVTYNFSPNTNVTREQMMLMIYRYAKYKEYDITQTSDFAGLLNGDKVSNWAEEGMRWAVGSGFIKGYEVEDGLDLAPQNTARRGQLAAILQRFCEYYEI